MVTVTRKVGFFERIGNSVKGIFAGIVIVGLGIALLRWNEGRTVAQRTALNEGSEQVTTVTGFDEANEGVLIHYSDVATAEGSLEHSALGISEEEGLKFRVNWEVLQWEEKVTTTTEENLGGSQTETTEYKYKQERRKEQINSNNFEGPESEKYENKYIGLAPLGIEESVELSPIMVGEFEISNDLASSISQYKNYPISETMLGNVKELAFQALATQYPVVEQRGNQIYVAQNTGKDTVGDLRMGFEMIMDQEVSVIGGQAGMRIAEYRTSNDVDVSMLSQEKVSAAEMFAEAKATNEFVKWLLRVLGIIMIYAGFSMILKPLVVVGSVVPLLGSLVGLGTSLVSGALTIVIASITIALARMRFRPMLSVIVLAIGAALTGGIIYHKKKNSGDKPANKKKEDMPKMDKE